MLRWCEGASRWWCLHPHRMWRAGAGCRPVPSPRRRIRRSTRCVSAAALWRQLRERRRPCQLGFVPHGTSSANPRESSHRLEGRGREETTTCPRRRSPGLPADPDRMVRSSPRVRRRARAAASSSPSTASVTAAEPRSLRRGSGRTLGCHQSGALSGARIRIRESAAGVPAAALWRQLGIPASQGRFVGAAVGRWCGPVAPGEGAGDERDG